VAIDYVRVFVGGCLTIEVSNQKTLCFSNDEFRAFAEVPSSQRIVIGSADRSVRVWDLNAGAAVSLLGRHRREVTSLACHEIGGLVSADAEGTVIRWDLQSGQTLATATADDVSAVGVQSIRFSNDGTELAVLSRWWNSTQTQQTVSFMDCVSLKHLRTVTLDHSAAVVLAAGEQDWIGIDWTGNVRRIDTGELLARIGKPHVSALVLAQEAGFSNVDDTESQPSTETSR
jgi:bla regulator protein blaR1